MRPQYKKVDDEPGSGSAGMRLYAGADKIAETVVRLASAIERDYRGKSPVMVGVLKGAFVFLSDLARNIGVPLEVDFIRAASYGDGMESSGRVVITKDLETDVRGRHVIVVEDIVDTGHTLSALVEHLRGKGPASLRVCALLDKPSRRTAQVRIDYPGMEVEDRFIVGYGLDHAEKYRNLPALYELSRPVPEDE